jgi:hypothetical protein
MKLLDKYLGYLNFIILQWTFFRLARIYDENSNQTLGYKFLFYIPLTKWIWKIQYAALYF